MFETMLSITVIGMGTVFLALISLAVILWFIRLLAGPEPVWKKNKLARTAKIEAGSAREAVADGLEGILPVLAAAISASENSANFRIIKVKTLSQPLADWARKNKLRSTPKR